ncbi:MAG: hypothetical protein R3Y38_03425 [Rikenellaceae bacterium]
MTGVDKQESVFELIKSMTKAEKRNFKLYVTRLSGNQDAKFLSLFDLLDSLDKYDENKVLERCPIKKEQLPNTKAHLQKQLLISMRLLNVQHSDTMQIREQLDFAQILYNKGLYKQSSKILDKCYEQASKSQQHSTLIDIVQLMLQIETTDISSGISERASEFARQVTVRCNIISNINELYLIAIQLFDLHHKLGYARSQKDLDFIDNYFAPKLKSYDLNSLSFLEKFYFFQAKAWFYYIKHDFVISYRYACLWVDLFNSNEKMKFRMYDNYLRGYARILDGLYMMRRHRQLSERIESLEKEWDSFAKINENADIISSNILLTAKINLVFLKGNFEDGLELIKDKNIMRKADHASGSTKMWFYYKVACLYFGSGEYKKCMQYLSKITTTKDNTLRRDIQCYAKMLYLIASYEAGIDYNLDYQIRSVYSFLVKMNDMQEVQKELLTFLKRLNKIYEKDFKDELQKLYNNIKPYERHPYLQRTFYYLDIISWLESMLTSKTVSEIIQRKFAESL